jgi:SseB protein N-terminal domain
VVNHDRRLTTSAFPGDDGQARRQTRELLAAVGGEGSPHRYLRAVASLCGDRLLVPVVATAARIGRAAGPLASDKEAEMAVVLFQGRDGRRAMLAFTGLDSLQSWQEDARPVPVTLDVAAKTALAEGAAALIIDLAGPHTLAIEGVVLHELAAGHRLVETEPDAFGWAVPAGHGQPTAGE